MISSLMEHKRDDEYYVVAILFLAHELMHIQWSTFIFVFM